mgnify:FL=1
MRIAKLACSMGLALLALAGSACGDPCGDPEDRVVTLAELPCNRTSAEGVWESHPFPPLPGPECTWLEFRGCSKYEIQHPLGRAPSVVLGYTSFASDGSFSTVGSGNSFVVQEVSETAVTVRNAQNPFFYLRIALD